jgi:signal transduction histidine kinase
VTYWDWTLTPLLDDEGEVISLVLSLEEVTDRQAAEDTLRNSERQIRTLADQLIHVQENERKRIARDMHDSLGASLSALKYKLEDLIHNLSDRNQRQVGESLDALILIIQETIGEARRMQNDLRPPHLDDLGLLSTLSWLSREFQKVYSRITVDQRLAVLEEEIPERLKVVIFRIAQEAMNNIGKHARATRAWISLSREQNGLQLVIGDNGAGFNWKGLLEPTGRPSGIGLSVIKERADLSGGALSIVSHPGEGTMVEVWWALDSVTGVEDRTR